MSRRLDWPRTKWQNRYLETVHEGVAETFGPWKPATLRKALPFRTLDWKPGDKVLHKTHGIGIVLRKKRAFVRVQFKFVVRNFTYWEALDQLKFQEQNSLRDFS